MKKAVLYIALLIWGLSFAAGAFAGETTKSSLVMGVINEPTTLDPIAHDDPGSYMIMAAYIEGLFIQDADLKPQLCLAERYEVVDNASSPTATWASVTPPASP